MAYPRLPNSDDPNSVPRSPYSINEGSQNSGQPTSWYQGETRGNSDAISSANGKNQSNVSDHSQGVGAIPKNQPASDVNSNHSHMLERVVQFGKDSFTIKAYITCENQQLFALECERELSGYDGKCPVCHDLHLKLAKSRGYYTTVKSVYDALERQKVEKDRMQGRKKTERLNKIKDNLPPLDHPILGKDTGIEGDSNSCYMDATIFCMFAYSNVFDSLLHMDVKNKEPIHKLQKLLRQNIVNVLRSEEGFVERDTLFHLRNQLSEATGDKSFKEMEKDPSEFLRTLEQLFQYAPLKTVPPDQPPNENGSNVTTNIMWEMFDANPKNLPSTNIASIFRNSLAEIPAKLATIPPFLVLIAPRHTRSQRSYRYIKPDRQITLDNDILQLVCLECKKTNHRSENKGDFFSCYDCFSKEPSLLTSPSTNASITCYCSGCLKELHASVPEKERPEHDIKHMKNIKHKLNLFAVLCIETSHYVAFVKCHKPDQQHEWIFFDSMSDRIHNDKNVPCVSRVPNFDRWIDEVEKDQFFFEDLDRRRNQGRPTSQAFNEDEMRQIRLFRDGAFFFYENAAVNYQ